MANIKSILKRVGKSQCELASEVGVSQSAINHYANGNRKPSYEMAWSIINALNSFGAKCKFDDVFPNPQTDVLSEPQTNTTAKQ